MLIQVIDIRGYDTKFHGLTFDMTGKEACKAFFDRLFEDLRSQSYIYCEDIPGPNYTFQEKFYRYDAGALALTKSFAECHFYECIFYTTYSDGKDAGIVPFIYFSILNSGQVIRPGY
jgi:hypothetical protein